jgi:hypothetical protein
MSIGSRNCCSFASFQDKVVELINSDTHVGGTLPGGAVLMHAMGL